MSKRIHYGKFVAEAKFRSDPDTYTPLIQAQDAEAIMQSLTYPAVEQKVIDRVTMKTARHAQDLMVRVYIPLRPFLSTRRPVARQRGRGRARRRVCSAWYIESRLDEATPTEDRIAAFARVYIAETLEASFGRRSRQRLGWSTKAPGWECRAQPGALPAVDPEAA
jgi:chorismate mutase